MSTSNEFGVITVNRLPYGAPGIGAPRLTFSQGPPYSGECVLAFAPEPPDAEL